MGGRVEFVSRPGAGSTVRMTAPLRAVLTEVAVLCVGEERFGVALPSIRQVVRASAADVTAVGSGEAIVVGEEAIPLLHLGERIGGARSRCDPLTVVVIDGAEGRVGFVVDRIGETLRSPVQTAPPLLADLKTVAGSLLQPDGRVLLLLDLAALTS
jgi:two-component system chemotaxis sensor kinase CheA